MHIKSAWAQSPHVSVWCGSKVAVSSLPAVRNYKIVRVQYFVRGGFVGHRSRVSSKHLFSLIFRSTVFDSSGVKKGLRCSCKMHVWVSGPPKISTAAGSGYVTMVFESMPL
ncbi:hypothetical protein TNCV_4598341 [Trichonephila clavipes]|nr:hypothetical protein TNCV_4598341 [Trichonephila clavipes]